MSVIIRLIQNNIKRSSAYGKWFGKATSMGEVHNNDLAKSIEHATSFTAGDVEGVLKALVDTMQQEMQSGKTVVIDGLGRFRIALETEGVDKPEDFNRALHIKRMICKFSPATVFDRITRKHSDALCAGCNTSMLPEYDSPKQDNQ